MSSKKRTASLVEALDGDEPAPALKPNKKSKTVASAGAPDAKDDEGNPYWELSSKRRVGVSRFKNLCLVNIREYYDKDGKLLPGKKGISLSVEQYAALLKAVPAINAALQELGQDVGAAGEPGATAKPAKDKSKASKDKSKSSKDRSKSPKANIEATSDEDEG